MKNKRLVTGILLLVGISVSFPNVQAVNYYVSPSGDNNNSGSFKSPWKTLTYAVSTESPVSPGDSVFLFDGTYMEGDIIEFQKSGTPGKPITVKAINNYKAIIQGSGAAENIAWHAGQIRLFKKSHWVIEGLKVQDTPSWGIIMVSCRDILIKECWTYKTSASGIIAMPQSETENYNYNIRYHHCKVEWPQYAMVIWRQSHPDECHRGSPLQEGMDMWKVDTFEIVGCEVSYGSKELIDCKSGSKNGIVRDNIVHHGNPEDIYCYSGAGIYLDGASNVDVYNNIVYGGHGAGISVADEKGGTTRNVKVFNNVVYGNGLKDGAQAGISILDTVDNVHLFNNTVVGPTQEHGIKIKSVCISLCSVRNNIVINSGTRQIDINSKGNLHVTNNLVWGPSKIHYSGGYDNNGTVENNIVDTNGNVLFVNMAGNDYHLIAGSPAIDVAFAGIAPALDLDHMERPQGAGFDIGAYEYPFDAATRASGISITNCPSETFKINDVLNLQYTLHPDNVINKSVTWYSLDPSVAVIFQDGLLFGKGEGTTKIVVRSNDSAVCDTCNITVNTVPVSVSDDVENDNSIKVYPNPVKNNILYIGFEGDEAGVRIISMSGSIVFNETLTDSGSISLANLIPGIYHVHVTTSKISKSTIVVIV